jgi:ribonuclease HI
MQTQTTTHTTNQVTIYTDGACNKQYIGGYGAYLKSDSDELKLSGHEINTTNNRMELMGVIVALEKLKRFCNVTLYTDSVYVKEGITNWINKWKLNDWKTSNKKDVLNKDLWLRLDDVVKKHSIQWEWVKGHSGVEGNEIADQLATEAVKKYLNNKI